MVLLQRSWLCSRYRPQPMALPRAREMHSQAPGGGDMLTLCVPGCLTMAIFCPGVSKKGLGREKGPFVAMYRRRVFKMSWLWQDMRAMYPKSPANRRWRIHRAKILPGRGPFRCTNPSNHARRADLATIQRSQGLANGSQEELGIASALRIAADGPTTMIAYVCGSRARSRQLPLCGRWRKPMTVSAAASEQCSGAYARPVLRHLPARSVCLANGIRPPAATFAAGASRRPRAQ